MISIVKYVREDGQFEYVQRKQINVLPTALNFKD